jgi:hypothetical protein
MDERDAVVRELVARLMDAVEASLESSAAVREALDALTRQGFEPRLILLADARAPETEDEATEAEPDEAELADAVADDEAEPRDPHDLRYGLTARDRDFLRTVRIRPESG